MVRRQRAGRTYRATSAESGIQADTLARLERGGQPAHATAVALARWFRWTYQQVVAAAIVPMPGTDPTAVPTSIPLRFATTTPGPSTSSRSRTDLGRAIQDRRLVLRQTVRAVGLELDVAPSTLSRLERGQMGPSAETARRLADWLGWSLDDVVGASADARSAGRARPGPRRP